MPVGYSSPARNLFLLGSSGQQVITNFFESIDKSAGTDGVYLPDEIRYVFSNKKYALAGSAADSNSKGFGWLERQDYDLETGSLTTDYSNRIESTLQSANTTLRAMELDANDNLIVVGKTGTVPWIAKYSNDGVLDWQSTTNTGDLEYTGIATDSNGIHYACGNTPTLGSAQAFVEKFDINGNPGWGKSAFMLGRDVVLNAIDSNSRGHVVAVGHVEDDSNDKGYIVKIDTNTGEVLWDRTLSGDDNLSCTDLFIDNKDQIYITLSDSSYGYLLKYTPEGNVIWQKKTDQSSGTFSYNQVQSDSETEQTVVFGRYEDSGNQSGVLSKYAKDGQLIYRRSITSPVNNSDTFSNLCLDADPSFFYFIYTDQAIDGFVGTPDKYTFGKVSSSGNGFGDFEYQEGTGSTIDYVILYEPDQIGRLYDGSVRQDTSDLITYPFGANKLVFDDFATHVSNKKRQMDSADSFEYSGSPAIRVADFQELNLLGDIYSGSGNWLDQTGNGFDGEITSGSASKSIGQIVVTGKHPGSYNYGTGGAVTYDTYGTVNEDTTTTLPYSNSDWAHYGGKARDLGTGGFKVTLTNSAASNFFMACWVKFDTYATSRQMGVELFGNYVYWETLQNGKVAVRHNGGSRQDSANGTGIDDGNWHHIALSRDGSTLTGYVDGNIVVSTTGGVSGNSVPSNAEFWFFGGSGTAYNFDGQILDPIINIGTGTSGGILVPTKPAINSSGVSGEGGSGTGPFYSNTWEYVSPAITLGGGIFDAEPFSGGGSVKFDGDDDYLSLATSSDFALGTGDWTVEYFAFPESTAQYQRHFYLIGSSSNQIEGIFADSNGISFGRTSVWAPSAVSHTLNQWNHYALVHDSTNMRLYINGTEVLTSTNDFVDENKSLVIGHSNSTFGGFFDGYISNFRIVKGTALYTSNFTPSTSPLTDISGGALYSSMLTSPGLKTETAGFTQPHSNTGTNPIRSEGTGGLLFTPTTPITYSSSVEVLDNNNVTACWFNQTNSSGSSTQHSNGWVTVASGSGTINTMYFERTDNAPWDAGFCAIRVDGTILEDSPEFDTKLLCCQFNDTQTINTGKMYKSDTLYTTKAEVVAGGTLVDNGEQFDTDSSPSVQGDDVYFYYVPSGNETNGDQIFSADPGFVNDNSGSNNHFTTWWSYNGSNWVWGSGTGTYSNNNYASVYQFLFGSDGDTYRLDQNIDFYGVGNNGASSPTKMGGTAPTLNQYGTDTLTSAVSPGTIEMNGGARTMVTTSGSDGINYNVYGYFEFNGNSDNIFIDDPLQKLQFVDTGSDFAIECWAKRTAAGSGSFETMLSTWGQGSGIDGWIVAHDAGSLHFTWAPHSQATTFITGGTLNLNTWYHILVTKNGNAFTLYLDGVSVATGTNSGTINTSYDKLEIGHYGNNNASWFTGHISEVRIYPRGLTAAAVFQNYNATKSKYINKAPDTAPKIGPGIVTDSSLLLNYDFGNRASYDPIENLFPNSNLCQDTSTTIPYGWSGWNPATWLKMPHLNGPFRTNTTKVVAHGAVNQNGGGLRGEMTGLVPGATYTVSAYVRKISEEELAYWNANNSLGLTTGTNDGGQDVPWFAATKCRWDLQNISGTGDTPATQITLSDQWQRIERDFPASSDGDKRLILSNNVADTGTGNEDGGGVFLISALQLERKFNTLFGGNNRAGIWFATPYDSAIPSTSTVKNLITDSYPGLLDGAAYNKSGHFDFEGTDDCIQLSDAFPTGNNAWTWSAWIKPHYTEDGTPLFAGTESAGQAMISFCQDGAVRVGIWGNDYLTAGTAIADDTWGMTTWTFDGSTLTCYTNGQSDGTGTGLSFNITGSSVKIGSTLTQQYFGGGIAQVQIYNRALTAAEVAKNYNATVGEFVNRTDPYVAVTNEGYTPPVAGGGDLYTFTSAYFTVSQALTDDTTSQEHRFGPSQAEVRGWLSGTANGGGGHDWADTYVDCPQDGYQRWQVPKTGKYTITAKGGGAGQCQQSYIGRGVKVIADFNLTKGDYLILAAGQGVPDDLNSDSCNGGGGATWVMSGSNYATAIPLIVANGAGGDSSDGVAKQQPNIVLGSSFTVTPTAAQGGGSAVTGKQTQPILSNVYSSLAFGLGDNDTTQPNSAGWLTDGADVPGETPGIGGHCFRTDLIGGTRSDSSAGYGGFGGGSGGQDEEGNAGGGFTGAHGNDNNEKTGHGSTFVNDNNEGNVSVQLAQATTTYQNSDYTSEDQYQGWIKIEFVS